MKTGKSESNLRLYRECCGSELKIHFPDGEDEGASIVPALDTRSQVFSISIEETALENLSSYGSGQLFTLIAPDLCVPGLSREVLQRVISQASTASAQRPPFRLTALSPPGGREAFPRFPVLRVFFFGSNVRCAHRGVATSE